MDCKRGLVLEGGGAKGAYQFGVLQAFRDENIEFDVVVGTSVGALNAALWAGDRMEFGEKFWKTLSQDRVYPFRRPRPLFFLLSPIVVLLHFVVGYFQRKLPEDQDRAFGRIAWLCHLGLAAAWCVGLFFVLSNHWFAGLLYVIFTGFIPFTLLCPSSERRDLFLFYAGAWLALLTMSIVALLVDGISSQLGLIAALLLTLVVCVLALSVFAVLIDLLSPTTFLSSLPLRAAIQEELVPAAFRIPAIATIAERRRIHDPDNHTSRPALSPSTGPPRFKLIVPWRHVPRYRSITDASDEQRLCLLLASAALPFGIVPEVQIGDDSFVDGGTADNCPVFPVASCAELVVVRLEPTPTDWENAQVVRWQEIRRMHTLAEEDPPEEYSSDCRSAHNQPYVECKFESPPTPFPKLHVVAPKAPLACCFITGTMNFSERYANRLMDQGYRDGKEFLKSRPFRS